MINVTSSNRPRVLLIAEAANPEWTSVPLIGWSLSRALLDVVDGHVVTHLRNRDSLLRAGLEESRHFTAIDSDRIAQPLDALGWHLRGGRKADGKGWTTVQALNTLAYYYFERLVWQKFGSRIAAREFDVVHRITPLSPAIPSTLARKCHRCRVPFVLGPLNGGIAWPKWFRQERHAENEWLAPFRRVHRLLPSYQATRKYSAAIIAGSRDTMRQMPRGCAEKLHYLPENAIDTSRFSLTRARCPKLPLKLLFVGRLVPYKGADMVLEAAEPLISRGIAELTVVGDGPMREQLELRAASSAHPSKIRFTGAVPHSSVQQYFADADLFVFPSIREFGGGVVLEAMAMGAVPIVVGYGGPAELVFDGVGFTLPIGPRSQIVSQLQHTLEQIALSPTVLSELSDAGRTHVVTNFTWQAKAAEIMKVYAKVVRGDLTSQMVATKEMARTE